MFLARQGEADLIIKFMNEFVLSGLLKIGTKTWQGGGKTRDCKSTIDLILTPAILTEVIVNEAIVNEAPTGKRGVE